MGLGERLNGIQEVSGSIPLISTKDRDEFSVFFIFRGKAQREPLTSCFLISQRQPPTAQARWRFDPAYLHHRDTKTESFCFRFFYLFEILVPYFLEK